MEISKICWICPKPWPKIIEFESVWYFCIRAVRDVTGKGRPARNSCRELVEQFGELVVCFIRDIGMLG